MTCQADLRFALRGSGSLADLDSDAERHENRKPSIIRRRNTPSPPSARSTAPTRAASTSPCRTAASPSIDGSHAEPGHRRLHLREGPPLRRARLRPDRLLYPAVRKGPKGFAQLRSASRGTTRSATIAERMREARDRWGGESILPYSYGGSNGLLTQDTSDATLFRRLGASRLARTVCAAPTGAANMAMYGKMPSVTYEDYPGGAPDRRVGRQPVGVRHSPRPVHPRGAAPRRDAGRRRSADDAARQAGRHPPGGAARAPTCRWRWRSTATSSRKGAPTTAFLARTRAARSGCASARGRGRSSARPPKPASPADALRTVAELYAATSPALIRCGWGQERNRNGGNASLAILALPAVAGKFGVRGGGYTMSNSASWGITRHVDWRRRAADAPRQHEPPRARAPRRRPIRR